MSIIAIRSMQLTAKTTEAWKSAGVAFARRGRTTQELLDKGREWGTLLNLGMTNFRPESFEGVDLWNHGKDIQPLLWPGSSRELFFDLMPPRPTTFPSDVWIKTPGSAGRGKFRKQVEQRLTLPHQWDWQAHIDGQEYRLVTVHHKVVQCLLRHGTNGDRTYEWIRMREVPMYLKDMVRDAASRLDGQNVVAWDIIDTGERGYLFEGNSCPGVSPETAARIVKQMKEHTNA